MTARPGREAVFLARGSYRQRRYRDLARVLPFAGGVLFLIPLLWPRGGEDGATTSFALIYLFSVWGVLILAAAILSRIIRYGEEEEDTAAASPDGPVAPGDGTGAAQ